MNRDRSSCTVARAKKRRRRSRYGFTLVACFAAVAMMLSNPAIAQNAPPIVTEFLVGGQAVTAVDIPVNDPVGVDVSFIAQDPEGGPLTYQVTGSNVSVTQLNINLWRVNLSAVVGQSRSIDFIAIDSEGASVSRTLTLTAVAPPLFVAFQVLESTEVIEGDSITLDIVRFNGPPG